MANRLIEGFDWFPPELTVQQMSLTSPIYAKRNWFTNVIPNSTMRDNNNMATFSYLPASSVGRFGYGRAMYWKGTFWNGQSTSDPSGWAFMDKPVGGPPLSRGFVGMAMKLEAPVLGAERPCTALVMFGDALTEGTGNNQMTLAFDKDGVIRLYRGRWGASIDGGGFSWGNGTLVASSYAGTWPQDVWFYLEVGLNCATTGGNCEVRINTVPVINFSGNTSNTGTSTWDTVKLGFVGNGVFTNTIPGFAFDDFYVNDTAGATCNSFMGNVRVQTQFPDGAGDKTEFSIGGSSPPAANWEAANNRYMDDRAYVEATAIGTTDLYNLQTLVSGNAIYAVQASMVARQVDTLQVKARSVIKTNGSEHEGVDHFLNSTFSFFKTVWETNPATGVAWTQAELAALQLGPKKAS